ncbi:MAG TPA: CHAD domain-containing protein [Polyangia bacterium]
MAFRLSGPDDAGRRLRQGFVGELTRLRRLVTSPAGPSAARRDDTVHEVRKSLKRLRAMLRLLRDVLGEAEYRRENLALRDTARPLAEVRDAKVFIGTIEALARRRSPRGTVARQLAHLREGLVAHHRALAERVLGTDRALEATATVLAAVGARAERWPLPQHRGWSLLKPGFERTYRRGRRAWTRARRKGTSEALHEWRKEVKYLLYQLQIVEPAWGASERALARRLDRLADLLGEDHDLAVVRTIVSDPVVDRLISARRTALQRQAFALGGRVYQAPTAARLRSLRSGWKRWHA